MGSTYFTGLSGEKINLEPTSTQLSVVVLQQDDQAHRVVREYSEDAGDTVIIRSLVEQRRGTRAFRVTDTSATRVDVRGTERDIRVVSLRTPSGTIVVPTPFIRLKFRKMPSPEQQTTIAREFGLSKPDVRRADQPKPLREHSVEFYSKGDWQTWFEKANDIRLRYPENIEFAVVDLLVPIERSGLVRPPTPDRLSRVREGHFSAQWHLNNTGQGGGTPREDVRAKGAWQHSMGRTEVKVAIIDDGVDLDNPMLRAQCEDGYDFVLNQPRGTPKTFHFPYNKMAGNDIHGTPCAGVVAANGTDGLWGIAPECKIVPTRVFNADELVPMSTLAEAVEWASTQADILSCSWSAGVQDPQLESAFRKARSEGREGRGTIALCASGNESRSQVSFPAVIDSVLAIGASTNMGLRASYSNYGTGLDFVAPSSGGTLGITTTDVSQTDRGFSPSSVTDSFGGTSSATPLAAGVVALMLSVHPTLSFDDVREILKQTASKIDAGRARYDESGWSAMYGFGRIDAEAAVREAWWQSSERGRSSPSKTADGEATLTAIAERLSAITERLERSAVPAQPIELPSNPVSGGKREF